LRAPDRALSRELAALYKVTIGFSELLAALLLDETIDADGTIAEEDVLFAWLEARPFLIGQRQVCAGTRSQIMAVWRALRENGEPTPMVDWNAPWVVPAIDALIELAALAASAAGAARAYVMNGTLDEVPSMSDFDRHPTCLRLFMSESVPRLCETLRTCRGAGAAHPSLLFAAAEVPASLRSFLHALPDAAASVTPFARTDALLQSHALAVAARLMAALGREAQPLTCAAFRGAS
jgi:hypothetical protein